MNNDSGGKPHNAHESGGSLTTMIWDGDDYLHMRT